MVLLTAAAAISAHAQDASRPITIVVPYAAGQNTPDILARIIADQLQRRWSQPVVVENKPGASGNIGTFSVARAAPDGNTLLMVAPAFAQNVSLYKKIPFDPVKDFTPVIEVAKVPFGLVVNSAVPVSSTREFIAYAKTRPGQLNYASPGIGTPHHLAMEMFKSVTGIDIRHIPYIGSGPSVQSLIGGQTQAMFLALAGALPLYRGHQLKLLSVAEKERVSIAPEIPTFEEQGVHGMEMGIWNGLLAPAGTPRAVIERYNSALNDILRSPEISGKLTKQAMNVVGGPPERFGDLIKTELVKWRKVVQEAKISAE
jgi:tripartite-type tricarboxylate transporter receptor subunit TctC